MPLPAAFDLSGRVAVIIGAGSPDRIGFATARLLADLGAAVMISATTARVHDRVSELRGAGFDAVGFTGDLTDATTAAGLVSAALDQWGRLDIVVNNAGMISAADPVFESGTVESMDLATWQAALARNLTTAFLPNPARAQPRAGHPRRPQRHPGEVAAAIAWLASPGASYITGQYLVLDGGNSISEQRATPA